MFLFFSGLATLIAISIVYATYNFVRDERSLRRLEQSREFEKMETLKGIRETCIILQNATSTTTTNKAITELKATEKFVKEYY
jgi:hypothetical protein